MNLLGMFKSDSSKPAVKPNNPYWLPKGTTPDDWVEYNFAPKPDITAYELALILSMYTHLNYGTYFVYRDEARLSPIDRERWPLVKRHFEPTQKGDTHA